MMTCKHVVLLGYYNGSLREVPEVFGLTALAVSYDHVLNMTNHFMVGLNWQSRSPEHSQRSTVLNDH